MPHFNAISTKEFITKAIMIHGDLFNYELVDYVNNHTKISIICHIHGKFSQSPNDHLNSRGCKKCGIEQRSNAKNEKARNDFNIKAKNTHGDLYNYNLVKYINAKTKIKIYCNFHKKYFWQLPSTHISGQGCPQCGKYKISNNQTSNTIEFIKKAKIIHNDLYSYNDVDYIKSNIKVKINCKKHGSFNQRPNDHLNRKGCPKCGIGKETENSFEYFLNELHPNINYIREYSTLNLSNNPRNKKGRYDFYLQDIDVIFELDGRQHYKPIKFFGGVLNFIKLKKADLIKNRLAVDNKIEIFRIPYFEFSKNMPENKKLEYFINKINPIITER